MVPEQSTSHQRWFCCPVLQDEFKVWGWIWVNSSMALLCFLAQVSWRCLYSSQEDTDLKSEGAWTWAHGCSFQTDHRKEQMLRSPPGLSFSRELHTRTQKNIPSRGRKKALFIGIIPYKTHLFFKGTEFLGQKKDWPGKLTFPLEGEIAYYSALV